MQNLIELLLENDSPASLIKTIQRNPGAAVVLAHLRRAVPDLHSIPQTTYTLYREFEKNGQRRGFERQHFLKRSMLTRAVAEMLLGDGSNEEELRDIVHDLLWSICEETSWVLPAHEEQGPDFWDLKPSPRQQPWGAHTALTREPDAIDLFAAETGASLAETVYLLGDRLAPEVVQRVRQEVERHIFKPYLAYGRKHWWFKGALNWNGVCNGSIGLAFLRLERDPQTLAEALSMVLEGFDAYIATGFEADGGSIEGPGYWNYGLMYFVTLAEELRERTGGRLDLIGAPDRVERMRDIARYQIIMALSPGIYTCFGDATEQLAVEPGIVQRLSERAGMPELRGLIVDPAKLEAGVATAKLAIVMRDMAWWDGEAGPFPQSAYADAVLPEVGVVKLTTQTPGGKPVVLEAKAGHNDGHHSHTDIGQFIYHVDGETLLPDAGRGMYAKEYFRQQRYENIFNNSYSHSVPRIGGQLQAPGPEFGGMQQFHGAIVAHGAIANGEVEGGKAVVIDFHRAYDLPALTQARRTLTLAEGGALTLEDAFAFAGDPLPLEEAFVTWHAVELNGGTARICGERTTLELTIAEPQGAVFTAERLEEACRTNQREGVLTRLAVNLPAGTLRFMMSIQPKK